MPNLPLGQWFYDEFYVHHSLQNHNPQDRVAYAVNGQVVFDINLSTIPEPSASNPPRGMKLTPGYLNVENMQLLTDDLAADSLLRCSSQAFRRSRGGMLEAARFSVAYSSVVVRSPDCVGSARIP